MHQLAGVELSKRKAIDLRGSKMYNKDRAACRITKRETRAKQEKQRERERNESTSKLREAKPKTKPVRAHTPRRAGSPINSLRAATAKCSPLRGDNENYK